VTTATAREPAPVAAAAADRLAELETLIATGLDTFREVGEALAEVRDHKLFRAAGYRSFHAYTRERWHLSYPRAAELIRAAAVADALEQAGEKPPARGSTARPLTPILTRDGPDATVQAWRHVREQHNGNGDPSEREVRRILATDTPGVTPDRGALDETGRLLAQVEQYLERIGREPLPRELRPTAARYALRAEAIADDCHQLASGRVLRPLTDREVCVGHGAARDAAGVCRRCRRPDVVQP
jgi:hypothetical protein